MVRVLIYICHRDTFIVSLFRVDSRKGSERDWFVTSTWSLRLRNLTLTQGSKQKCLYLLLNGSQN